MSKKVSVTRYTDRDRIVKALEAELEVMTHMGEPQAFLDGLAFAISIAKQSNND